LAQAILAQVFFQSIVREGYVYPKNDV